MSFHNFLYGAYPYLAGTIFLLGSIVRFERDQYTWKTDSTQLVAGGPGFRVANYLFHIGILFIFFGHLIGMLAPHSLFRAFGISDLAHQYMAIYAGLIFGIMCLIGGVLLWIRRVTNPRVRAVGRTMDIFILTWILITLCLGLTTTATSLEHAAEGDVTIMLQLTAWVKSVATLSVDPSLIADVPLIYKIHLFFGMTVFLLFPFTRLVHIWSVPITYLWRSYQIVRVKKVKAV